MGFFKNLKQSLMGANLSTSGGVDGQGPYGPGRPKKRGTPPHEQGEYRIRDKKTGEIEYAGKSSDIARRLQEHKRSGKFDPERQDAEWMTPRPGTTHAQVSEHEVRSIRKHGPRLNKSKGSQGRRPKER